jgi:hypothetical protein
MAHRLDGCHHEPRHAKVPHSGRFSNFCGDIVAMNSRIMIQEAGKAVETMLSSTATPAVACECGMPQKSVPEFLYPFCGSNWSVVSLENLR